MWAVKRAVYPESLPSTTENYNDIASLLQGFTVIQFYCVFIIHIQGKFNSQSLFDHSLEVMASRQQDK